MRTVWATETVLSTSVAEHRLCKALCVSSSAIAPHSEDKANNTIPQADEADRLKMCRVEILLVSFSTDNIPHQY